MYSASSLIPEYFALNCFHLITLQLHDQSQMNIPVWFYNPMIFLQNETFQNDFIFAGLLGLIRHKHYIFYRYSYSFIPLLELPYYYATLLHFQCPPYWAAFKKKIFFNPPCRLLLPWKTKVHFFLSASYFLHSILTTSVAWIILIQYRISNFRRFL